MDRSMTGATSEDECLSRVTRRTMLWRRARQIGLCDGGEEEQERRRMSQMRSTRVCNCTLKCCPALSNHGPPNTSHARAHLSRVSTVLACSPITVLLKLCIAGNLPGVFRSSL
ncbi:hypothetical protein BU23DRAFT_107604 [Bimuria novae-zelandiae CBS 107.79]|uniref:Uncharacterized protein n=1 Tax=Bimuria novae-zelandiae CBS 107.79 TaxID=1447943 RepID=A0A6A5VT05_9PLEO|nr:hypothetical protein BU23DRAFT_107604 [Bimuria novae-zelandiae CBS 107.79]